MVIYYQRSVPSPNQSFSYTLEDFTGGLNNRSLEPAPNQGVDLMNMRFTEDGFLEKRKGIAYYSDFSYNGKITYLDTFKPYKDTPKLITVTTNTLYLNNTGYANALGQVMGVNHNGRYIFVDTNNFRCIGTFSDLVVSTYTSIIGDVPGADAVLIVTGPPQDYVPLPIEHVIGKTVYNFNSGTIHYEPCLNELQDTSKGPNVLPSNPAYIINREGRVYVAGSTESDDTVFISDVNNPFYFPNNLSLQLPPNSDKIRGLVLYNNTVVVGRESDIHVIRGETNNLFLQQSLFTLQQLSAHVGLSNQRTFVSAHNYCFFLGTDGQFYVIRSLNTDSDELATAVISKSIDLTLKPLNFSPDDYSNASATFFQNSYYVVIGDKVLIYNYLHQAWTVYNQINASFPFKKDNQLIFGTNDGRLVTASDNYLNLGVPYRAYYSTRYLDMGDSSSFKFFREFVVVARTFDNWRSDIRFTFEIDYAEFDVGIKIRNQISVWGVSKFGDRFINKNINATHPLQIGQRGRVLQMHYENSYDVTDTVATVADLPSYIQGEGENYLYKVTSEDAYYLFINREWVKQSTEDLNQPMRIIRINAFYELRGRRY